MTTCLISDKRLVEDLRYLDQHSPPRLDGWGRNRCQWAADRIEALEEQRADLLAALKALVAIYDDEFGMVAPEMDAALAAISKAEPPNWKSEKDVAP